MRYLPLAGSPHLPGNLPDAEAIRAYAKQSILDRWQRGEITEIEAESLIAELGLRDA